MRICKWKTTRSDGNRNGVFPQIVIWFLATVQKPPTRVAHKIDGISVGGQKWRNPPGRSSFGFPFWEISKISACSVIVPMRTTSSDRNWSMSSGETVNRSSKSSPPLRAISSVSSGSVNAAIKFGSIEYSPTDRAAANKSGSEIVDGAYAIPIASTDLR